MGRISMPQGKGSQLHNRREYEKIGREIPDNINKNLSAKNVTIIDRDIREAYGEIFGEALQEYNNNQKRTDRKIDNYYDHISKSKNKEKIFYEDVLQWGKKEDFENNPQLKEKAKDALTKYVLTFQQRNPNLKIIGAYIHMDEASPHLHLDYVPIAHGYSKGLKTRNSLDRAMKEMGYIPEKESRKNNATKLWKESERAYFGEICRSYGLEVEEERKARGSLSVEEYKDARDKILGNIEQERNVVAQQLNSLAKASKDFVDENRTEPLVFNAPNGKQEYMPIPELQKRSQSLDIEIANNKLLYNDLMAQIDELNLSRDNLIQKLEKVQNELLEVQELGKYLDEYEKHSKINIYESEIPDGFLKKKTVVVVDSDLDAEQVQDIFRSNSIRKGVIEEAKDNIRQGQEEADQMLKDAAETIRQAQEIQNQRDQILTLAEREGDSIIAKAEAKAKEIIANLQETIAKLQETIRKLKEEIAELLGRKNKLQKEADQIISGAKEEADNIIKNAPKIEDRFSSARRESEMIKKVKRYEKVINSSPELKNLFEKAESSMQQQENSRYK